MLEIARPDLPDRIAQSDAIAFANEYARQMPVKRLHPASMRDANGIAEVTRLPGMRDGARSRRDHRGAHRRHDVDTLMHAVDAEDGMPAHAETHCETPFDRPAQSAFAFEHAAFGQHVRTRT